MRSLGNPIAEGGTAEIYAWQEGQILKLFQAWFPPDEVEHEAKMARLIHGAGLPVPAVGEMIEVNQRLGVVYERVEGQRMLEGWKTTPSKLWKSARFLAELQADIHSYQIAGLPSLPKRLMEKIKAVLPLALQEPVLNALTSLPDGSQLCHGDFHPYNILLTERGPIIVDWGNATRGNPLADVARTSLLLTLGILPPCIINRIILTLVRGWFESCYIKRYQKVHPYNQEQLRAWLPVVAAAHLNKNDQGEEERLLAVVEAALKVKVT